MALVVVDRYPGTDASGVYINDVVWAQFSQQVDSDTVTYYNFTVSERDTYLPVEGTVQLKGVSGNIDDAVAVFVPTNGFARNTRYSVLLSSAIKAKTGGGYLDHDTVWYFTTTNVAISGNIGDLQYDLDPSGLTSSGTTTAGPVSGATPLAVIATTPEDYATNQDNDTPHISITFNDVIPSGINLYEHIDITSKGVLG